MKLLKNTSYIYGFEDYNIVPIYNNIFKQTWDYYLPYCFDNSTGSYIFPKDLPVRVYKDGEGWWTNVAFEPALCQNHKELLNTANKVYVHPSCKLSRSMMAEKYKKSLNPYLSDAVVIPKPDYSELRLNNEVVFINEEAKILVRVKWDTDDDGTNNLINSLREGDILGHCISCSLQLNSYHKAPYTTEDVLNAEFLYAGPLLYVPNSHSYVMDILTNSIPVNKIVFEPSVQESLSDETNQLDFDSLTSIKDMLESSDENTVAAGLKSLSMMDWMHYPNSIKFILAEVDKWKWAYNNASNSTSVKYMLNTISNSNTRRNWPGYYDDKIYEQDYELFKQLKMYYENISNENILEYIRGYNFMGVRDNIIVPILKAVS